MFFLIAFIAVIILISYIYTSFAMMRTAQRLKTEPAWLAWVPVGNMYLMSKMAKMHWWPVVMYILGLPMLIFSICGMILSYNLSNFPFPVTNPTLLLSSFLLLLLALILLLVVSVFSYIWLWKICQFRGKPGWWAIIPLVSFIGIPFSMMPMIGPLLNNLISLAASIWTFVMWGILAWGKDEEAKVALQEEKLVADVSTQKPIEAKKEVKPKPKAHIKSHKSSATSERKAKSKK
jgi:hypothetical protein